MWVCADYLRVFVSQDVACMPFKYWGILLIQDRYYCAWTADGVGAIVHLNVCVGECQPWLIPLAKLSWEFISGAKHSKTYISTQLTCSGFLWTSCFCLPLIKTYSKIVRFAVIPFWWDWEETVLDLIICLSCPYTSHCGMIKNHVSFILLLSPFNLFSPCMAQASRHIRCVLQDAHAFINGVWLSV